MPSRWCSARRAASEQAFLGAHGAVSVAPRCRPWRGRMTGERRWSRSRPSTAPIRCSEQSSPNPAMPLAALFARQGDAFGAAVDPALLSRLDLKPGDRITHRQCGDRAARRAQERAGQARRRHRLRPAPPHERGGAARERRSSSPAAWCAGNTGCGCPIATRATAPWRRSRRRRGATHPNAGWDIRTRNKASPQLERNVERFSQFLTLVALTALLVGGVGVANAVASHLARKRDVDRHDEGAWARPAATSSPSIARRSCWLRCSLRCIGAVLGAALPFVIAWVFGCSIPLPVAPLPVPEHARRFRSPTACSPLSPSPCGRSDGPTTFRSRCCSATRSPPSGAGRGAATSSPPH